MAKELRANIRVGGIADSSFYALGNQIAALGNLLNPISKRLLEFGKESVKAFASYEDSMLEAQVALRTQYSSASELSAVMEQLDKSALQWANDSRFSTEDVAGAIANAAHAGWDLEKILNGVPSAMKLSLAGGMDLSQGLEYMVDISNAAGISFQELGELTDFWAYSANRSSTTIPEMGEAMQKMGATLQFVKGDMAGLTTMLAVLADNGTKGTAAGTLLRNTMLRLIAPTKTAAEAMGDLNLTADELDDIYKDDSGLEKANKLLQDAGFSAYDSKGDLKSFLDIFKELNAATKDMTEADRNDLLSSIFPTRTITGALALLKAADSEWNGLYDDIQTAGKGYADYAAETMESGEGGTLRHLESVYNTLQTKVGQSLSGEVSKGATAISGMLEAVNGMDNRSFTALVDGMGTLALAGPAMTTVGAAMKFLPMLGSVLSNPAAIAAGLAVAGFGVGKIISDLNEASALEQWGNLGLDENNIRGWLNGIDDDFSKATQSITNYADASKNAADAYKNSSSLLKESLLTFSATGKNLTDADKAGLGNFAKQMTESVIETIENSNTSAQMAIAMFGHGDIAENMTNSLEDARNTSISKASEIGQEISAAIQKAISDNVINIDEIINIQSIVDKMNQLELDQIEADAEADYALALNKAQNLGLDETNKMVGILQESENARIEAVDKAFKNAFAQQFTANKYDLEAGKITQEEADARIEELNSEYKQAVNAEKSKTKAAQVSALLAAITGTEMGGILDSIASDAEMGIANLDTLSDYKGIKAGVRNKFAKSISSAIEQIGGFEELSDMLNFANSTGDNAFAGNLQRLMDIASIASAPDNAMIDSIASANAQTQLAVDTSQGQAAIDSIQAPPLEIEVTADASEAKAEIDSVQGKTVYIDVITRNFGGGGGGGGGGSFTGFGGKFAEGGRADEASIFGEAGPEWAIPEAHTSRTAELLRQAAQASGFTWPELMTGNSSSGGNTLVYSPTIVAQNAEGVETKLVEDKQRLEKQLKEMKWIDGLEVYA